jgi:endo-1,3(4)-beta-glucanase
VLISSDGGTTTDRSPVREEWEAYFSNGRVDQVGGGWRGILYANLALVDSPAAYRFFSQPGFDPGWLDGGASKTWLLAYIAALGGA